MSRGARIKEIVRRLKIIYGDDSPLEIIKKRNIVLCYLDEKSVSKGAYKKFLGTQFIYINTGLSFFEKRLTYTHELGHSIIHPDVDTFELKRTDPISLTKYENEANLFAAEFLLEDDVLDKYPGESIYDIARKECVSVELLKLKISNLNIDNSDYECSENFQEYYDYGTYQDHYTYHEL